MTDKTPTPQLELKKIYLKDVSFESPKSPYAFAQEDLNPIISVEVTISTKKLDKDQDFYEVVLNITVTAKQPEDQILYLCEVQQAGLFTLNSENPQALDAMLGIACPSILLPYAREAIHNLIGKGGYEPIMINPMNFEAAFRQRKQMEKTQAEQATKDNTNDSQSEDSPSNGNGADADDKPTLN